MRRKLVAGNWKMNGSLDALAELDAIAAASRARAVDVAVAVPATLIAAAAARGVTIGAQDVHHNETWARIPAACPRRWSSASRRPLRRSSAIPSAATTQRESDGEVKAKAEAARRCGGLSP